MKNYASSATAKFGLAALAGLSLLGAVTGCTSTQATNAGDDSTVSSPAASAPAKTSPAATPPAATSPAATSPAATGTPASGGTLKDGAYSEIGHYESPAGNESITVAVTLVSGVITKVTVTPHATDPTTKIYQGQFVDGVAAVVVGKKIDSINVSRVSGSSLTSAGFNEAIHKIKTDATT